jgi:hypothetical protein
MTTPNDEAEPSLESLTERLSETYVNLQRILNASEETPRDEQEMDVQLTAFSQAMTAALTRIQFFATTQATDSIDALAKLTLLLLRIAPSLTVEQCLNVTGSCGATVERFNFDTRLCSEGHCQLLFSNVVSFLEYRKHCIETDEDTDGVDQVLRLLCPPLMAFFSQNLSLLAQLRSEEESKQSLDGLNEYKHATKMIRQFLKQLVDGTILCVFVEKTDGETPKISYAQRVKFTGVCANQELAHWAMGSGGLCQDLLEIGTEIEMDCWTALRFDGALEQMDSAHRIFQEGIPDDIAPLEGEKVVLFHRGKMNRFVAGKVFPLIEMKAELVGSKFTEKELEELQQRITSASTQGVVRALQHQLARGGRDGDLRVLIDSFVSTA